MNQQAIMTMARSYGFTTKKRGGNIIISARDTDRQSVEWLRINMQEAVVNIMGNTDHLNLWFYETRPDLTPEKLMGFIRELNVLLQMEEPIGLSTLIDPEDWQALAGVKDAYEDNRYVGMPVYISIYPFDDEKAICEEYDVDIICGCYVLWDMEQAGRLMNDLSYREGIGVNRDMAEGIIDFESNYLVENNNQIKEYLADNGIHQIATYTCPYNEKIDRYRYLFVEASVIFGACQIALYSYRENSDERVMLKSIIYEKPFDLITLLTQMKTVALTYC